MRQPALEQRAQLFRVLLRVVDARQQHPLVADAAARLPRVLLRRVDQVADRVLAVDRDEDVPQLVARGVQRDCERDWDLLLAELSDARDEPARRDDYAARADAEQLGVGQPPHRIDDRLVVGHRFAHAHEHDMRQAPAFGRQDPLRVERLLDDLVPLEVAPKRKLARGAEGTADGTACL